MATPNQLPSQPLSGPVPVTVIFSNPGSPGLPFNQGIVIGASPVLNSVTSRVQVYSSTAAMLTDGFVNTDPEYVAMELYFDQSPAPQQGWVGRQDLTAIATLVVSVSPAKTITVGGSGGTGYVVGNTVSINGVTGSLVQVTSVSGGAVTGVLLLAGGTGASVANNIATTAVTGSGSGFTIDVTAVGSGGGTGYAVGDTIAVVQVGATPGYATVATVSTGVVTSLTVNQGSQGTGYTVAKGIPTTTTGAGTGLEVDITAVGETPVQAVEACRAATPLWYMGTFVGKHADGTLATNGDYEAIAAFIESASPPCQFWYTDGEAATLAGQVASLPGFLQSSSYQRAGTVYSSIQGPVTLASVTSGSPTATVVNALNIAVGMLIVGNGIPDGTVVSAIVGTTVTMSANATATSGSVSLAFGAAPNNLYTAAAVMGRAMGLNTMSPGSYYALAYKNIIGVIAELLSVNQAALISGNAQRTSKGLDCNVVVDYQFGSYISLLQFGNMASDNYFDEILQLDMLANDIQTTIFNYFTTALSVPITDGGVTIIKNLVQQCCARSQAIGFIAPSGVWQGITIGTGNQQVGPGSPFPQGYYIYAPSVTTLSTQQLANRQLPPITVLLIEASSGISQAVIVYVQP